MFRASGFGFRVPGVVLGFGFRVCTYIPYRGEVSAMFLGFGKRRRLRRMTWNLEGSREVWEGSMPSIRWGCTVFCFPERGKCRCTEANFRSQGSGFWESWTVLGCSRLIFPCSGRDCVKSVILNEVVSPETGLARLEANDVDEVDDSLVCQRRTPPDLLHGVVKLQLLS